MPLLDHFRPPLGVRRDRHGVHHGWACNIASDLNRRLPRGYFAEPNVQFRVEIDVATFEAADFEPDPAWSGGVALAVWTAPPPTLTIPIQMIEEVAEVKVFSGAGGPRLVGAIELVSPSNKDRPDSRDAFVNKCAAYLQQGLGLVVVDVVTDRQSDWHGELLNRLGWTEENGLDADLSTSAYRPVERAGRTSLDIWREGLKLGSALITMPLWLPGKLCLPVDLESAYDRTCREERITF